MSGLLLLGVIGLWAWACTAMTRGLTPETGPLWRRSLIASVAFFGLMALPVADEIIGGFQFRALCKKNAVFRIGVAIPEGRITRFSANPANSVVPWTAITIYDTAVEYKDVNTGEMVVRFHLYVAKGGIFIRMLGISEDNSPITMGRSSCSPEELRGETISRTLNFSVIN